MEEMTDTRYQMLDPRSKLGLSSVGCKGAQRPICFIIEVWDAGS